MNLTALEGQKTYVGNPTRNPGSSQEYANHLGPKSEKRILDSADFWGVFNS